MGLGILFSPKKSKQKELEPDVKEETTIQKEDDVPPPESSEEPPKLHSANVAYPFHDVKATTFPPPLSIDASVFTDPQHLVQTDSEDKTRRSHHIEDKNANENLNADETEERNEIKNNKVTLSSANGTCDSKNCTKVNCRAEMSENTIKKQHDSLSEEKVSPVQLTEMINNSIKEAMQTIVKQCRMDERKDADKKPKKEVEQSVCYANKEEISMKAKQFDRMRSSRDNTKLTCLQKKYNNVRSFPKKPHDENEKCRVRKDNVEDRKTKRHVKPTNNMKADNRKMTGNVNIYICSEATENAQQATNKQKKCPPCTETSSETTTDQSNISASKLVSYIRKKRRESKERNSLDFLPKREESSDISNDCTCLSNCTDSDITTKLESNDFINVCNTSDEIVSLQDTDSNLTECQCKDANVSSSDVMVGKSIPSLPRSKFVICNKVEPCATIYPSNILSSTDSDKWSSKSICNSIECGSYGQRSEIDKKRVLCDKDGKDSWSLEQKSFFGNYCPNNFSRDYSINENESYTMHSKRNCMKTCKCHTKDQELLVNCNAPNHYRNKRHKMIEKQDSIPWSTCSCIVEEEEEDVTACKKVSQDLREQPTQFVACKEHFTDLKESIEEEKEKLLKNTVISGSKEKNESEQESGEEKTVKSDETDPADKDLNTKKAETGEQKTEEQTTEEQKTEEQKTEEQKTEEQKTEEQNKASLPKRVFLKTPPKSPRLLRPEARVLKLLLQQQGKPTTETAKQGNVTPSLVKHDDNLKKGTKSISETRTEQKPEPAFLKKFNLPERYKLPREAVKKETEETVPQETIEKESEDKAIKDKGDQGSEKTKETSHQKSKKSPIFKVFTKFLNKTGRSEVQSKESEENKITEKALSDTDTANTADTLEPKNDANPLPIKPKTERKEMHKENKRNVPLKTDTLKRNEETNKTKINVDASKDMLANKENRKSVTGDEVPKTLNPVNEEEVNENERKPTSEGGRESQSKSKLLASILNKKLTPPSMQNVNGDLTKRKKSQGLLKESETQQITKMPEIPKPAEKSVTQRKSHDQEKKETESTEATGQAEMMSRRGTRTKSHPDVEKEGTSACIECQRRRSSTKVSKQTVEQQCVRPRETEFHRLCTNTKFTKCGSVNDGFLMDKERPEDNRCSHCCLPISECNNQPINYPKGCLKRGNQFRRIDSQESNLLTPYHDNRSWEECGCRRVTAGDNCCRPRSDCSCRLTMTCGNCCKPKHECNCKTIYKRRDSCRCMKSMFCLYCDNPREKCTCRAPIQKCSCCELSVDLCLCEDRKSLCEGRPVLTEPDSDRTMYVTAWKPREEVRRYFSRNLEAHRVDPVNECCCHKLKSHNSDDLPYQRLSVFSDVMNELQQKISESSCTLCRKTPCCCNIKIDQEEGREERIIKYCVSPKTQRKILACKGQATLKNKSPNVCCKCDTGQVRSEKPMKIIIPLCCGCKTTPCRCKKSKSRQKKPKAKCYYCKTSPCTCITSREHSKSRPCRCADSPCRAKEKEIIPCGKTSTKPRNNEEKIICVS